MRGRESHFLPHSCLEVNKESFESYLYPVFHLLIPGYEATNERTNKCAHCLLVVRKIQIKTDKNEKNYWLKVVQYSFLWTIRVSPTFP